MASTAIKQISTGTLSLKFMQNAQRKKQEKEIELERAEVLDDGKWEVSKDVRDRWGNVEERKSTAVAYEPSYLPFLFPSLQAVEGDNNVEKPKGRRSFKKGVEVSIETIQPSPSEQLEPSKPSTEHSELKKLKKLGSLRGSMDDSKKRKAKSKPTDDDTHEQPKMMKSARELIHETANVGVDLRRSTQKNVGFLKPDGVAEPSRSTRTGEANRDKNVDEQDDREVEDVDADDGEVLMTVRETKGKKRRKESGNGGEQIDNENGIKRKKRKKRQDVSA